MIINAEKKVRRVSTYLFNVNKKGWQSYFEFFCLLFGCPTANFGPLYRRQTRLPDVYRPALWLGPEAWQSA